MADAETLASGGVQSRKEKRKALKKLKRKQIRIEAAIKEREEEEVLSNDPDEQLRLRLKEEEEAAIAERARKEFEERERIWLEKRKAEEEERRQREIIEESENRKNQQIEDANKEEEDGEWEYVEDGPAEIIWQGNEIIVKKKRVKVSKTSADRKTEQDVDRPTSNPLPPQSLAFASYNSAKHITAQEALEDVSQQVPNFGTEQDKAHCPFHLKTGACRFGARCNRAHFYPDKSSTLLIKSMYSGPGLAWEQDEGLEKYISWEWWLKGFALLRMKTSLISTLCWDVLQWTLLQYTDEEIERSFEEFYEDVHTEFLKFGELVNFKVCKNGSYHLRGNVYVHYKSLESAVLAYNTMNARYFAGKQITCEFVGVTRWKVAICGEYMKSRLKTCSHGTACNFIHCFRNPGGDYEWADWDNPPPKYWIKKMAVLFGQSDESGYGKQMEEDDFERSRDSSKKRTSIRSRYHSRRSYDDKMDVRRSGSGKETSDKKWDRHNRHSVEREHSRRSYDDKTDVHDSGSGKETLDRKWDKHNRHSVEREHSRRIKSPDHKMNDSGSDKECSSQRRERHSRHSDRVHFSRSKETRFLDRSEQSERNHKSTSHDNNAEYRPVGRRSNEERSKDSEFLRGHDRHEKKLSMKEEKSERKHRFVTHRRHSEEDRPSDQLSNDTDESRDQTLGLSSEEYYNRHGFDSQDHYDGKYESRYHRSHTYNIEHKGKFVKQEVNHNRYTSVEPHDRWKATDENSDLDENLGNGSDDSHTKEIKSCGKTKYHRENHKKAPKKRKHKVPTLSSDEEVDRRAHKKSSLSRTPAWSSTSSEEKNIQQSGHNS